MKKLFEGTSNPFLSLCNNLRSCETPNKWKKNLLRHPLDMDLKDYLTHYACSAMRIGDQLIRNILIHAHPAKKAAVKCVF
jgi:hypothetical protein